MFIKREIAYPAEDMWHPVFLNDEDLVELGRRDEAAAALQPHLSRFLNLDYRITHTVHIPYLLSLVCSSTTVCCKGVLRIVKT